MYTSLFKTTLADGLPMRLSLAAALLFASTLPAVVLRAEAPKIEVAESVPPLSLSSLYHPADRFKYVDSPTPAMRWVRAIDNEIECLIKREDGWKRVDLQTLEEQAYGPLAQIESNLRALDNLDEKEVPAIVEHWVSHVEHIADPMLVRVGDSIALVDLGGSTRWVTRSATAWREVSLSPDAKRVAYVEANDLHFMQLDSGAVTRITHDGSPTKLNGVLDWVYQEEIYGRGNFRGYWWRPDSGAIAFLQLDTSNVAEFVVTASKQPRGEAILERYPKAGDAIPQAQVWCAKIKEHSAGHDVTLAPLLKDVLDRDVLVTRVGWHETANDLLVQTSNRIQNDVSLYKINIDAPVDRQLLVREQCDKWLEVQELPKVLSSGEYLRLSDLPSGRRRLWRISHDGMTRSPVTPADFDVREVLFVAPDDRYVLLTGDRLRGTIGQQVYEIDLQGGSAPKRLTNESAWHSVTLSEDGKWMIDRASSLTEPTTTWLRSLESSTSAARVMHQERLRLPTEPQEVVWPSVQTSDGIALPTYLIRPRDNDSSAPRSNKASRRDAAPDRYPVLIEIYGGPLAPSVRDAWSAGRYLFHQFLAAEGIGVLVVDNRSSGGRGLADSWSIHQRMGTVETQDLVAAAQWLAEQPWVNPQRLAVRGWSFGGFLTLHAMTHSDKFAAGVAGGSVTDWRNYDAIYTERYMGLPEQNPTGYDSTSPVLAADKIHGRVLLLHGEVDDNVHLANTLQMAAALQRAAKPFDMMIYPGSAHAVHDPRQNFHLMKTTLEFLKRELRVAPEK
ncbi:MAG: DPP IV N-terminal domain-containing protein [Planctomycetaceae bacterium]